MNVRTLGTAALAAALVTLACAPAPAHSKNSTRCSALRPCHAALHHFELEAGYYQNASRVGDTNVAGYPEMRLDYGVVPNVELFYDPPSEIAKSVFSAPTYFMTSPGYGFRYATSPVAGSEYTVTGEIAPPNSALANPLLLSRSALDFAGYWPSGNSFEYSADVGMLSFSEIDRRLRRSSPVGGLSFAQAFGTKTALTAAIQLQSRSFFDAGAQTSGIVGLQHELSQETLFEVQAGSAFNATAHSKPHYLGFDVAVR